jgi:hypothetical protein
MIPPEKYFFPPQYAFANPHVYQPIAKFLLKFIVRMKTFFLWDKNVLLENTKKNICVD